MRAWRDFEPVADGDLLADPVAERTDVGNVDHGTSLTASRSSAEVALRTRRRDVLRLRDGCRADLYGLDVAARLL